MNKYEMRINFNMCTGTVDVSAENDQEAIEKALDYVCKQLYDALPELDIEVEANIDECFVGGDPDMAYEEERDRYN